MIKKNQNLIQYLSIAEPDICKNILKSVTDDFIHFIGEIALNILTGNITLSEYLLDKLHPFSQVIRDLASRRIRNKRRRRICIKNYKAVCFMLKTVLPKVVEIFYKKKE